MNFGQAVWVLCSNLCHQKRETVGRSMVSRGENRHGCRMEGRRKKRHIDCHPEREEVRGWMDDDGGGRKEKKATNFSLLLLPSLFPSTDNNTLYTCERPFSYLLMLLYITEVHRYSMTLPNYCTYHWLNGIYKSNLQVEIIFIVLTISLLCISNPNHVLPISIITL